MGREGSEAARPCPSGFEYRRAVEDRYPPDDFLPPEGIVWAREENSQAIGSKGQPAPESYFCPLWREPSPSRPMSAPPKPETPQPAMRTL
jgi:hypothetical protein